MMSEEKKHKRKKSERRDGSSGTLKKKKIKSIGQYSLGDVLGKGGFGIVYKGLNQEDGSQVAVKQVSLRKCTKEQVEDIHSEINLLKKLHHDLIVRYIDHKQSKTKLYIIIEYVEGGSLQDQMKKYGIFKESLVAKYVKQVLIGLNYLHNEGVIHRDIKGANILTTKDGAIKLADFGVAAALTDAESENPVGTPYWMAPEIIELNPATPKSDIWSVGATIIELLTGEPPYFKLDPMPALYRIVQDESPPIPECSKLCEDFLYKCFQKDPELRNSAEKLLKHPWITVNNSDISEEEEEKKRKKEDEEKERKRKEEEKKKQDSRLSAEKKLQLLQYAEDEDETDSWGDFGDDEPIDIAIGQQLADNTEKDIPLLKEYRQSANLQNVKDKILNGNQRLYDDEDSDYDDMFENDPFADDNEDGDIDFAKKLQQKMANNDDDDDPFQDTIESDFGEIDFGPTPEVTMKDEELKQETRTRDLFSSLDLSKNESEIIEICTKLCEILEQYPRLKTKITQNTGAVTLREFLDTDNLNIVLPVLKLINSIIIIDDISQALESRTFCETLCLLGVLPAVMKYAGTEFSIAIRQEACAFIYEMCNVSALTLQMFIACRGLPTLVELLAHDERNFAERSDIIFSSIDGILRVFNIPDPNNTRKPKNDFCVLLCKANLMVYLSSILVLLSQDPSLRAKQYLDRVVTIFVLFSNADSVVKKYMAHEVALSNLLKAIKLLENNANMKLSLVKCVKNLALDPVTFDSFVKTGAIANLVGILAERREETSNQVIAALYSLTLVNKERQNIAAQAGIIPELQYTITSDSPLKYPALNLICALAHASSIARQELWKNDGVKFFIKILRINGYQVNAMEALREWITEDTKQVQNELCKKENVDELVDVFNTVSKGVFASMLQPLQNILNVSVKVNKALSNSTNFVSKVMKNSLLQPQSDALIRVLQLKIVQSLYKWCDHPKKMMTDLYPVIKQITQTEKGVLVTEIAMNLLTAFEVNVKL